jgi:hypothetical protein
MVSGVAQKCDRVMEKAPLLSVDGFAFTVLPDTIVIGSRPDVELGVAPFTVAELNPTVPKSASGGATCAHSGRACPPRFGMQLSAEGWKGVCAGTQGAPKDLQTRMISSYRCGRAMSRKNELMYPFRTSPACRSGWPRPKARALWPPERLSLARGRPSDG